MTVLGLGSGLWLARTDPALLEERMSPPVQRDQPKADKTFVVAFGVAALVWFIAIGLDRRYLLSDVPRPLQVLGLAMLVASTASIM
jgi:hypothetical protein